MPGRARCHTVLMSLEPVPDAAVRTARTSDAAAVGELQCRIWRSAYADVLTPEVIDSFQPAAFAALWEESLRTPPTPQHRLLVATEGEAFVGFAAVGPTEPVGRGELLLLGVDPAYRQHGHGSRLLNAAVETLRANDLREMEVWLLASDEATRGFLDAAGLQPDGAWRDRVVADDGGTAREVRLLASIVDR